MVARRIDLKKKRTLMTLTICSNADTDSEEEEELSGEESWWN